MLGFAQEKQGIMLQPAGGQRCRYVGGEQTAISSLCGNRVAILHTMHLGTKKSQQAHSKEQQALG